MTLVVSSVKKTIIKSMRDWALYDQEFRIYTFRIGRGLRDISLGYGTPRYQDATYWDANVIGSKFYLLHIQIVREYRGKGHGAALYEIIERIAAELGCREVRQHPSGTTSAGETRRSYLERRGWTSDGIEVFKKTNVGCGLRESLGLKDVAV